MKKYKISEETVNKILLYTAMALPDHPGEKGMKASDTKKYFYEFIKVLTNAINTELGNIVDGVTSDISAHDVSGEAHSNIRKLISNLVEKDGAIDKLIESLQEKDTELGNSIGTKIDVHNQDTSAHPKIVEALIQKIANHNQYDKAHNDIRLTVSAIESLAIDAYNLARGKSKIYPMYDYGEFIYNVNSEPEKYNVGDMFIFDNKQAPDFMLFEKDVEFVSGEDDLEITGDYLPEGFEFEPGQRIVINGIRFVIQESGYDMSKLATDEELKAAREALAELISALNTRADEISTEMQSKENLFAKEESTASEIELETHKEYNLGLITTLVLSLPEDTSGFECIVNFRTGATALTFDSPGELVFSGDDAHEGRFYPITNRLYEINIKDVMGILTARVGATDYEVIE